MNNDINKNIYDLINNKIENTKSDEEFKEVKPKVERKLTQRDLFVIVKKTKKA